MAWWSSVKQAGCEAQERCVTLGGKGHKHKNRQIQYTVFGDNMTFWSVLEREEETAEQLCVGYEELQAMQNLVL